MRISDWSSDVCSSDLQIADINGHQHISGRFFAFGAHALEQAVFYEYGINLDACVGGIGIEQGLDQLGLTRGVQADLIRSEEHTSELQSLMRISYAVFCLKKKK